MYQCCKDQTWFIFVVDFAVGVSMYIGAFYEENIEFCRFIKLFTHS